jgi:uncharacterized protein
MSRFMKPTAPLTGSIKLYQRVMSGRHSPCRFVPSCSTYALEALDQRGLLVGSGLAAYRVCRCNPWGGSGFDPVPPKKPNRRNKASVGAHHSTTSQQQSSASTGHEG